MENKYEIDETEREHTRNENKPDLIVALTSFFSNFRKFCRKVLRPTKKECVIE